MISSRGAIDRICFGVLMGVGVAFVALGLTVIPLMPYFQLDAVLLPADRNDPNCRAETLAVLNRAAGNQWLFWTGGGLLVIVKSGIGLRSAPRPGECDKIRTRATPER
jgi:hypothetical protein